MDVSFKKATASLGGWFATSVENSCPLADAGWLVLISRLIAAVVTAAAAVGCDTAVPPVHHVRGGSAWAPVLAPTWYP